MFQLREVTSRSVAGSENDNNDSDDIKNNIHDNDNIENNDDDINDNNTDNNDIKNSNNNNDNVNKTSQELQMLSTVTLDCQVTKIVMNLGSQL